jgi:hypothetical protein
LIVWQQQQEVLQPQQRESLHRDDGQRRVRQGSSHSVDASDFRDDASPEFPSRRRPERKVLPPLSRALQQQQQPDPEKFGRRGVVGQKSQKEHAQVVSRSGTGVLNQIVRLG